MALTQERRDQLRGGVGVTPVAFGAGLLAGSGLEHLGAGLPGICAGVVGGAGAMYGIRRGHEHLKGAGDGFASNWQVTRTLSEIAARRSATVTRPSLRSSWRVSATDCGARVGRATKPPGGRALYASYEDVVLAVG